MRTDYTHRGVTWVDLERPTLEEVESIVDEFGLGPFIEQEMLSPTAKPRIDLFPSFVYLVLHFPSSRHSHGREETHEVDLVVAKNLVITVHYDSVPAIVDFSSSFEAAMLLKKEKAALHSGHILFELASRLYQSVQDELESLEDEVTLIEKGIFDRNREKEMVKPISMLTRELLNHKRIISNHEQILSEFETTATKLFGDEFKTYVVALATLQYRVFSHTQILLDTLAELRATNDSLLSTRQNEIMKNLTIVASIMLPLSLLSSLFGMNTEHNPFVGHPADFWIIVMLMAVIAVATILYFKFKKWF